MKLTVLSNINSGQFKAGDVALFDDAEALALIEAGAAKEFTGDEPVATDPTPTEEATVTETPLAPVEPTPAGTVETPSAPATPSKTLRNEGVQPTANEIAKTLDSTDMPIIS